MENYIVLRWWCSLLQAFHSDAPFGGLYVWLFGDYMSLGPVPSFLHNKYQFVLDWFSPDYPLRSLRLEASFFHALARLNRDHVSFHDETRYALRQLNRLDPEEFEDFASAPQIVVSQDDQINER